MDPVNSVFFYIEEETRGAGVVFHDTRFMDPRTKTLKLLPNRQI